MSTILQERHKEGTETKNNNFLLSFLKRELPINQPDIILALLTGVLPPGMLDELIRAWSFTTVSRKQIIKLDSVLLDVLNQLGRNKSNYLQSLPLIYTLYHF